MSAACRVFPLIFTLIILFLAIQNGFGQNTLWTDLAESGIVANSKDRLIVPLRYKTVRLDFEQLKTLLSTAPDETEVFAGDPGLELSFPSPGGGLLRFRIWDAPIMEPGLAAKFPEIRSFAGQGIDEPASTLRFDISSDGLHAMILGSRSGAIFIDPYARGNTRDYVCYYRKDFVKKTAAAFRCLLEDDNHLEKEEKVVKARAGDCGNIRRYRLALACTGEYANFHGATGANITPAVNAMNTSLNRVNGIFERDCSIRLILVANNNNLIYTNAATDPYTNDDGPTMLDENQLTCDAVIGTANYDMGHVFSTGGGGIATLNSPCNSSTKARGVTGSPAPVGDPFDVDYVLHEMGHQFSARHTQFNNCNRTNSSAMEPGSASTIMGYAGICAPNVQSNSDDYYHARSLQQIGTFVTGLGNTCPTLIPNGNSAPTAAAVVDRSVPHSTPFILSGSATDSNNDALTFCWEQMDPYTSPQSMPPQSTNTSGPVFRSFLPTSSGSRYFPRYSDVLTNTNYDWEELPSVTRTMSFRMTVRDNRANGGCTTEKDMLVSTSSTIGPFRVTQPNTAVTYSANSTQTILWNVAGSTNAPVSCANVDILISHDGGYNYSTLVSNTPNDGAQNVTIPLPATNAARIMVRAVGNVFYDISDVDFVIAQAAPVELIGFKATLLGQTVRLDWSTASEAGNQGFQIERSLGDGLDFQPVDWIDGHGTTTSKQSYFWVDKQLRPGFVHYYRLRQTDSDGAVSYSGVQAVDVNAEARQPTLFPNPAGAFLNMQIPAGTSREAVWAIRIWAEDGKLAAEHEVQAGASIPVHHLPKGAYSIQVSVDDVPFYGRFLKD